MKMKCSSALFAMECQTAALLAVTCLTKPEMSGIQESLRIKITQGFLLYKASQLILWCLLLP